MDEQDFKDLMARKILSKTTQDLYIIYYRKLEHLIYEVGEINQEVIDAFVTRYPHIVARGFLKCFFEYINYSFKIPKITGRGKKKEIKPLNNSELKEVRENLFLINPKYVVMFDLTIGCALRRQEVLNIKVKDITQVEQPDGTYKTYIKIKGKGNRERTVFIKWDDGGSTLNDWIFEMGNEYTLNDYVFKSPKFDDRPMCKTAWNKAFRKASGQRFHPHLLRHTKSTQWYEEGKDIVRIQQRLGHSDISTTRRYINPDAKKELELWSKE